MRYVWEKEKLTFPSEAEVRLSLRKTFPQQIMKKKDQKKRDRVKFAGAIGILQFCPQLIHNNFHVSRLTHNDPRAAPSQGTGE